MGEHEATVVATVRVGGSRVQFSTHATIRYRDRVRPGLLVRDAVEELRRVAEHGQVTVRPEWVQDPFEGREEPPDAYLVIGDAVAFPLVAGVARTCLIRGSVSPRALERRAARRALRAEQRKARRQDRGWKPGDRPGRRRGMREAGG